ncbi:DUF3768 domain-containing protein [Rhizobium sp. PP-CC-3G-465]|uniref:DUF3768 domain-containing protein n=1 Tax=Rhizobium sp. PP-CC-3G-465 TaxID=2135648 RepID=UPI0010429EBC|nr:uncharacterized protein DUF3768 [Rhizobium sp. PP-CC-3G-465]
MALDLETTRIRQLNDMLRKWPFPPLGEMLVTTGIMALSAQDRVDVLRKVAAFDAFTEDNDPHGEHDFGAFEHNGTRYFWKIDYYDLKREYHSPNPSDPEVTRRVLTVMHASEY